MLKNCIFVLIVAFLYLNWGDTTKQINPPPDFSKNHGGKVILYTTSWCGYCAKARKLLKENNVDYFEYDIEKSAEGDRQHKALGKNTIPILLINGEVVVGYNEKLILELIKSMPVNLENIKLTINNGNT